MARVDERLIHGRVINEWAEVLKPTHLHIVDDALVDDEFMANIYKALAPLWLDVQITSTVQAQRRFQGEKNSELRIFLLAKTPVPFDALLQAGIDIPQVTLADKIYLPNKLRIPLSDRKAINRLIGKGVQVEAKNSPEDKPIVIEKYNL